MTKVTSFIKRHSTAFTFLGIIGFAGIVTAAAVLCPAQVPESTDAE